MESTKRLKKEFLKFCFDNHLIQLGSFYTKLGSISPYYHDPKRLYSGKIMSEYGNYMAHRLFTEISSSLTVSAIYGRAQKGASLASTLSRSLYEKLSFDVDLIFANSQINTINLPPHIRKSGIVIVDDVINTGKSLRSVLNTLKTVDIQPSAIIIAIDKCEEITDFHTPYRAINVTSKLSASQSIELEFNIPVFSIIDVHDIRHYLNSKYDHSIPWRSIKALDAYVSEKCL